MYVILDVVINHSGDVWAYPGDFPYYYFQGQTFPLALAQIGAGGAFAG